EPFRPINNIFSAEVLISTGQYAAAVAVLEDLKTPSAILSYNRNVALAKAYAAQARYGEAADVLLLIQGQASQQAVEAAARLMRTAPNASADPEKLPALSADLNFIYLYVGAPGRVLEYGERLAQVGSAQNFLRQLWAPEYGAVHKTERFRT